MNIPEQGLVRLAKDQSLPKARYLHVPMGDIAETARKELWGIGFRRIRNV